MVEEVITKRDKEILIWIEKYGAITINQAKILFFNGVYDNARRRLRILEEQGILNSYTLKETKEKVYCTDRKLSLHDIYIFNYIAKLKELGCRIKDIELKPRYLKDSLIPDAFVSFSYYEDLYITFLEVDYKHATEILKFKSSYERLYREKDKHKEFQGTFPIIVVAGFSKNVRYNSANFNTVWTTLDYSKLDELLL